MHFVVDDQTEAALVEHIEMSEGCKLVLAVRQDLVGRDSHGSDRLLLAGVLANLVFTQVGLVQDLAHPLAHGHGIGRQHQGVGLKQLHHADTHHGLATTARQHHHAAATEIRAAAMERRRGRLLVAPQGEGVALLGFAAQRERQRVAAHVARAVVDWIAQAHKHLLDRPPVCLLYPQGAIAMVCNQLLQLVVGRKFGKQVRLGARQYELAAAILGRFELQQAVAPVPLGQLRQYRSRDREARVQDQPINDRGERLAQCRRIPHADCRDLVEVDVLGRLLQFGKALESIARHLVARVLRFQQHGAVLLHDEGGFGHDSSTVVVLRFLLRLAGVGASATCANRSFKKRPV